MAAQLDEIEKVRDSLLRSAVPVFSLADDPSQNLAQFSPRQLKPEIFDDSPVRPTSLRSIGSIRSNRAGGQRSPLQYV